VEIRIDGFEELLRRIVREELAEAREGWMNGREAAEYIGVSTDQLHNLVSEGRLPRHGQKGQRLRFRRCDLDAYVEARR
jgi:excisionase family DNA binding protein